MKQLPSRALGALMLCALASACSTTEGLGLDSGSSFSPEDPGFESPDRPVGVGNDQEPGEPPEVERESTFRAPVVTGKYVWTANPDSGRVAAIDAETLEIHSAEAGFLPTHVAAVNLPDALPRALVINVGSSDATLLELGAQAAIETRSVALHQGADSLDVAPGGRFVVAWTDARKAERLDPTDGFQDVTVIELTEAGALTPTRLTVGYRPSAFVFDAEGRRAYGITEDGISVIELEAGAARLSRLVSLPRRAGVQPDVSVTPDGARAFARIQGSPVLHDIDLASGVAREIELSGLITDFDLSEDGQTAVAVVRDPAAPASGGDAGTVDAAAPDARAPDAAAPELAPEARAIFIPIPGGLTDASLRRSVDSVGEGFGSVVLSADGTRAVLFTTARPSGRVTLVSPDFEQRRVDLLAPVRAVFLTADGTHGLALQEPAAGSLRKGAFSVLSLADVRSPKLVAADAPAEAVALPPNNPERALVTVSDPASGNFGAFLVRLPNLQVDFHSLPSRPLSSGTIPVANKAFVAQAHPEGRITFIDLVDGEGRELTGFELSSKVVNE